MDGWIYQGLKGKFRLSHCFGNCVENQVDLLLFLWRILKVCLSFGTRYQHETAFSSFPYVMNEKFGCYKLLRNSNIFLELVHTELALWIGPQIISPQKPLLLIVVRKPSNHGVLIDTFSFIIKGPLVAFWFVYTDQFGFFCQWVLIVGQFQFAFLIRAFFHDANEFGLLEVVNRRVLRLSVDK